MIDSDRGTTRLRRILLLPAVAAVTVLLGFPLAMLVRSSFMPGDGPGASPGWSLRHYAAMFADPFLIKVVLEPLAAGVAVTVFTAIVGFPLAYMLARSSERTRRFKLIVLI